MCGECTGRCREKDFHVVVVVGELLWPTKTKSEISREKRTTEKPNKTLECMCLPGTGTNMYMHDSRLHIHI